MNASKHRNRVSVWLTQVLIADRTHLFHAARGKKSKVHTQVFLISQGRRGGSFFIWAASPATAGGGINIVCRIREEQLALIYYVGSTYLVPTLAPLY